MKTPRNFTANPQQIKQTDDGHWTFKAGTGSDAAMIVRKTYVTIQATLSEIAYHTVYDREKGTGKGLVGKISGLNQELLALVVGDARNPTTMLRSQETGEFGILAATANAAQIIGGHAPAILAKLREDVMKELIETIRPGAGATGKIRLKFEAYVEHAGEGKEPRPFIVLPSTEPVDAQIEAIVIDTPV